MQGHCISESVYQYNQSRSRRILQQQHNNEPIYNTRGNKNLPNYNSEDHKNSSVLTFEVQQAGFSNHKPTAAL